MLLYSGNGFIYINRMGDIGATVYGLDRIDRYPNHTLCVIIRLGLVMYQVILSKILASKAPQLWFEKKKTICGWNHVNLHLLCVSIDK